MKLKSLSILTAFALILALPMMVQAQDPNDPKEPESELEQDVEQTADEVEEDVEQTAAEVEEDVEAAGDEVEQEAEEAEDDLSAEDDEFAADDDRELPQTASPLALIALLGGTAAGSAFGVRALRRR